VILQLLANGLILGAVYSIVALGFGIIYTTTKTFHIAHGAVYTTSAYVFYLFYRVLTFSLGISLLLGLIVGVVLGILIELLIYHPLYERKASGGILLVSSIGVYVFVVNLIAMLFGNETKILSPGIERTYQIGTVILTRIQIVELLVFFVLMLCYLLLLRRTNLGKLVRGLADNPILLSVFGVEVSTLRIAVFAIGSLFAGVSSCLVALDVGIDPNVGMPAVLVSAVAMIIGGVGIFESAALGGFIIGILQNLAVWKLSARWQEAVIFTLLILCLLLRPQGILGKRRRIEEL
jgi:branched-chain amino acid transport system permease protein